MERWRRADAMMEAVNPQMRHLEAGRAPEAPDVLGTAVAVNLRAGAR
jgi:hypothetical protein